MRFRVRVVAGVLAAACTAASAAGAAEIDHYNPGIPNVRDLIMPDPGFYAVLYNYYYKTDRVNDPGGDKIRSINVNPGPGPGINVPVDVDVDIYALAPMFVWITDHKVLGAKYGAFFSPGFANSSISAALGNTSRLGRQADNDNFSIADWFFEPVWLGWSVPHFDVSAGYGFWAPTGEFDTAPIVLSNNETLRVESPDNIGYGFWTNQFQTNGAWYPWEDKRMAVTLTATYEIHSDKQDYDLTPGHNLTLNWGVSQFLPLTKDQHWLAEIALAGYDSWQVTDDEGRDTTSDAHDNVHAVGGQIGITQVPWGAALNLHYEYEFSSHDRFQGHVVLLSVGKKI